MWKYALVCLMLLAAPGCATRGRVSVIDFDLREAAQIEAGRFEAAVPYTPSPTNAVPPVLAKTEALPVSFWLQMLETLKVLKCRFRVISFEWSK